MATKTTYTQAPTWTAAQLATLFRTAFIDADLMTEWHASFLNTVENRVLEVTYQGAKAYGKTYYWFQFTTAGVFLQVCTGWNTTTNVPSGPGGIPGVQYLDWFSSATNVTTNHHQLVTLTATTQIDIARYQSTQAGRTGFAWFLIRNGATYANLHIAPPADTIAPWLDLDKVMYHSLHSATTGTVSNYAFLDFNNRPVALRRSFFTGGALRGNVALASFQDRWGWSTQRYYVWGNANAAVTNWTNVATTSLGVVLPTGFGNTNPAYTTNSTPIFHSLPFTLYQTSALPDDFGVSGVFLASGMTPIDRLVVTPAVEEWELITVSNNATVSNDTASAVFCARVV